VTGLPEEDEWETATISVDWEAPTSVDLVPSAVHLLSQLDKVVVGHPRAKEALVGALRMHIGRSDGRPPRVLMMGPHGVGKTTLAEALLAATDLPSVRIDFGEVASNGYADIPRMLSALGDGQYLPFGILFLDALECLAHPPKSAAPSFDHRAVQLELLRAIDALEAKNGGAGFRYDQLLICGSVTLEEPLKHTASQQELKSVLEQRVPLSPGLSSRFDILIPVDRLSAAQVAKSFAMEHSPFSRARRLISSLGGTFHCDPSSIGACAILTPEGEAVRQIEFHPPRSSRRRTRCRPPRSRSK
jgi:hypothetical protein